jgi:multidrug efflux pump subunit AcrA (membrane-fusion protein)
MMRHRALFRSLLLSFIGLIALLAAPGCRHEARNNYTSVSEAPIVRLTSPEVRKIVRVIEQPSFVQSYERSSVYPKMNAYIDKWIVDIGDKVKKGEVLAHLFVPELVEDHETKRATVVLNRERIALAKEVVAVARADVAAAVARLEEAKAELASFRAEAERWDTEVKRLKGEVDRGVVTPQDLLQSTNRWKASVASRDAAAATVLKADAALISRRAALAKAEIDVKVAEAALKVAESEEKRLQAWVDYLVLPAPYDGIIVGRNANTFDFVLPSKGDPSAFSRSPYQSPSGNAAPIYVVDRTDIVRVYVDVPEVYANHVHIGSKASVLIKAYRDQPIPGTVTRTSWALNIKSRTLRAEVDLRNPDSQVLPGMYAYAGITIERPDAWTLPVSALMHLGDRTILQVGQKAFCWTYKDGLATRVEVETGLLSNPDPRTGDQWIEVTRTRAATLETESIGGDHWAPIDGTEQVILGDLSILYDGARVNVAKPPDTSKVASGSPDRRPAKDQSAD